MEGLSVPHPTGHECDDHTEVGEEDRVTAEVIEAPELADDRPVDVVDKPARKRHVPVRPELPDVPFEKGIVEIFRELDAYQAGAAYRRQGGSNHGQRCADHRESGRSERGCKANLERCGEGDLPLLQEGVDSGDGRRRSGEHQSVT